MTLLGRIFGQPDVPEHNYRESALAFPELDVERIAKRLQLAQEGTRRGSTNEPPIAPDSFDPIEARVTAEIDREAKAAYEAYAAHSAAYSDRISGLGIANIVASLGASAQSVRVDLDAQIQHGRDALFELAEAVTGTRGELQAFQRTHELDRRSRHPVSRRKHAALALLLVLVEAPLNGTFLAAGNVMGLLGGVSQALVIAVINVATGLFAGRFIFPNILHRSRLRHLAGTVAGVAAAFLIITFNLAVAHYRAALQSSDPRNAERQAVQAFLASPMNIDEISGWLLFAVGIGFACIAAADGWRMDDPYPGYGAVARRYEEAHDDYVAERSERLNALEDVRRLSIDRLESLSRELEAKARQYRSLAQSQVALHERFDQHLNHLEHCCNDLLSRYRHANRMARIADPPAHFSTPWRLARPGSLARPAGIEIDDDLARAAALAASDLKQVRESVDAAFQDALRRYRAMDDLIGATTANADNSTRPAPQA